MINITLLDRDDLAIGLSTIPFKDIIYTDFKRNPKFPNIFLNSDIIAFLSDYEEDKDKVFILKHRWEKSNVIVTKEEFFNNLKF
jgi:hypothetical protein